MSCATRRAPSASFCSSAPAASLIILRASVEKSALTWVVSVSRSLRFFDTPLAVIWCRMAVTLFIITAMLLV